MAWSLVNAGAFGGASGTDPSASPGAPSGSGGLLLLIGYSRDVPGPNTPSGWTLITGGTARLKLFGRIADGSGPDTPAVTATGTGTIGAQIARWTGGPASLADIVAASENWNGVESAFDISTPAVAGVADDNCLVVYGGGATNDDLGASPALPNGSTSIGVTNYNPSGNDIALAWSYAVQTTAANIAASKFDGPNTGTPTTNSFVILLKAAATATQALEGAAVAGATASAAFSGFEINADALLPPAVLLGAAVAGATAAAALTVTGAEQPEATTVPREARQWILAISPAGALTRRAA